MVCPLFSNILIAGRDLTARAANITSAQGGLLASAGNDLRIEAGESTLNVAEQHKTKSKGFLSSSKTTTRDTLNETSAIASTFSGDNVTLIADRDMAIKGSKIVATNDTTLTAGRDIVIGAATEAHSETHVLDKKKSGFLSSGLDSLNKTSDAQRAQGSIVSAGRDLSLTAGIQPISDNNGAAPVASAPGNLTVQGSALDAGRDLAIQTTGDLQLLAAYSQSRETTQRTTQTRRKLETLNFELEQNRVLLSTLSAGNSIDLQVGGNVAAQIGATDASGKLQADRMTANGVIKGGDRQQVSLTHTDDDQRKSPRDKKGTTTNGPTSKVLGDLSAQGIRSGAADSFNPEAMQTGQAAVTALLQSGLLTVKNQPGVQAALNAPTPNGTALTAQDNTGKITLTVAGQAKVQAVYNQLKLTETFDVKHFADQGTAQAVTLVAAIALTVMTAGAGAASLGAVMAGSVGTTSMMINAALIAMTSTMTGQLAGGASFDEAFQAGLKAGATSAITAGVLNAQVIDTAQGMQSINQLANVQTTGSNIVGGFNADTFGQNLGGIAARGVVNAGVSTAINGGSFGDAFKSSVVGDLAAVGANAVGQGTNALSPGNIVGHAAIGCAAAAATGKDCASGAIGGAGAAIVNPLLDQAIGGVDGSGWGSNPETAQQVQTATLQLGSMGVSAAAAAALGKDGMTAALAAQNETVNNFLTKENITAKQARLAAAANGQEREAILYEYRQKSLANLKQAEQDLIAGNVMQRTTLENVREGLASLLATPLNPETRNQVQGSIREIDGLLSRNANQGLAEPIILGLQAVTLLPAIRLLGAEVLGSLVARSASTYEGSIARILTDGEMINPGTGAAFNGGRSVGVDSALPSGAAFDGTLYRAVGAGYDPLQIHAGNIANSHRYTGPGQGGLYFATGEHVVEAEFVKNGGSLAGTQMHAFPNTSVSNLLDVSNATVRDSLGITLQDLTRTGGTQAWRYEVTQPLGSWAQQNGYKGIIAPSAQANGGVNLIIFDAIGVK